MEDILKLCRNPRAVEKVMANRKRVAALLDRGVTILCPETIEVAQEVDLERISPSATLHSGTKLLGARTAIGEGAVVGREGPVVLENTVLGPSARVDGGYCSGATLLDGAAAGSWAHLREGTLLEEKAKVAHCVGLKQTLLFPYVTLGSLINFCDCLMAGGSGSADHSEVGSGYIHFNFTPRGDKVTASLFGDVPRGVLINQDRIFLGGLAASVGPLQVGYGAFLGPGSVYRRDVREGRFQLAEKQIRMQLDFDPKVLTGIRVKLKKSFEYLGNLAALWHWYTHIRPLFGGDGRALYYKEARAAVESAIRERVKQLEKLAAMVPESLDRLKAQGAAGRTLEEQSRLASRIPALKEVILSYPELEGEAASRELVGNAVAVKARPGNYLEVIPALPKEVKAAAVTWLQSIVNVVRERADGTWMET